MSVLIKDLLYIGDPRKFASFMRRALRQNFLTWLLVGLFAPSLHAQEAHIKVLNAHSGKPVTNECLNIRFGSVRGAALLAPTNKEGVVVLHLGINEVTADAMSSHACNGMADVGPKAVPEGVGAIFVTGDYYVACQEYGKFIPGEPLTGDLRTKLMPSYPIKKILDSGVSAANTCGKFRVDPKPGELILFVRPLTLSEKWKL